MQQQLWLLPEFEPLRAVDRRAVATPETISASTSTTRTAA